MTGFLAGEADVTSETVVRDALRHIIACQAGNIPNVRIGLPNGAYGLMWSVIESVQQAGYLAEPGESNGYVNVSVPVDLLPGDPQARWGRCGTHTAALQARDQPLPPGPPFCPECGPWRRPT
jgi:hypothetical protein